MSYRKPSGSSETQIWSVSDAGTMNWFEMSLRKLEYFCIVCEEIVNEFEFTNVGAIFWNILNVRIDKKFIFAMINPLRIFNLLNNRKFPRCFVFSVKPDKDQAVDFTWCPVLEFCRFLDYILEKIEENLFWDFFWKLLRAFEIKKVLIQT